MPVMTERDAGQRMRELVWRVKEDMEQRFSPQYSGVNDEVAKHLKIEVRERKLQYGYGGTYIPGEFPRIAIDPTSGEQERLNFTYFHEVSHHLIRQDGELYGFLDDHSPRDLHPTLEHYCNIGAAEFLIPEADIREIIRNQGFSIELIRDLDTIFPASKPAVAIQLAQCAPHQCIVIVCEYGIVPQRSRHQAELGGIPRDVHPQLFVQYSSGSPSCRYKPGRFIPVPKDHFLAGIYESQIFTKGHDNIPFLSGTKWPVDCEGFFYKGKVYAVFHITDPPSPNQMALNL